MRKDDCRISRLPFSGAFTMTVYIQEKPENDLVVEYEHFESELAAIAKLESVAWPGHPICPHCKHQGPVYDLNKTRIGLKKCRRCCRQFTVRVGTAVEASHLPLHKWLQAVYLLCAGAKPISAQQLQRTLDITYKSAWLTAKRIRKSATKPH
jgi:transposase-like protein